MSSAHHESHDREHEQHGEVVDLIQQLLGNGPMPLPDSLDRLKFYLSVLDARDRNKIRDQDMTLTITHYRNPNRPPEIGFHMGRTELVFR